VSRPAPGNQTGSGERAGGTAPVHTGPQSSVGAWTFRGVEERGPSRGGESESMAGGRYARLVCGNMESVVLRVRLISGASMDVTYEQRDAGSEDEVVEHVVSTLSDASGVLRCRHGDRLLVLYARGVAAVEVGPRGAVL